MALREGWNFHNDIGMVVESAAREYLGHTGNHHDEFTDADHVENGSFVEAMLYILRKRLGVSENLNDFALRCAPYLGTSGIKIPPDDANALLQEFLMMMEK